MINKTLSIIGSIVIVLILIYAFTRKPKVRLDANGFPLNPKDGDTFTKDGQLYTFGSGTWVAEIVIPGPIIEPNPERSKCPEGSYECGTFTGTNVPKCCSSSEIRGDDKILVNQRQQVGVICPDWSNNLTHGLPKGVISPSTVCFLSGVKAPSCIIWKGIKYKFSFVDYVDFNGVKWRRLCYNKA